MPAEPVVVFKDLKKSYGRNTVLQDINLRIYPAAIHGILGPNGSGKTTLFNTLFYEKRREDIALKEGLTLCYNEAEPHFYAYMTGKEFLSLVSSGNAARIDDWNRLFRLPLEQYVHNYSTGMKKKILLLSALLLNKDLLLLDEPTNGLDLESVELFKAIMQELRRQGKTVLVSSHITETLTFICDRITLLKGPDGCKTYERKDFYLLEQDLNHLFATTHTSLRNLTGRLLDRP